jgi:DNA processing protein
MMTAISSNTKAILLLTAPLIAGRGSSSPDILTPGEYKRLARHLVNIKSEPADLLSPDAEELLKDCKLVIDDNRLKRLLSRGFLLSQAIERWQARAIWVVSRADANYPKRLKTRLRENAPAVLYGCGNYVFLDNGGLAVVGSRHVDEKLIEYTVAIGRLAARAGRTIISGGARGIDQSAMRGALEAGGKVIGVLADSLEKVSLKRDQRDMLLKDKLCLITPFDPSAGFNVGHAMQRNKLIYAFSDAALVVSTDLKKGGTWAGATEQIDKLQMVPVYVRLTDEPSPGIRALVQKGAIQWPEPRDVDTFDKVFCVSNPITPTSVSTFNGHQGLILAESGGPYPTSISAQNDTSLPFGRKENFKSKAVNEDTTNHINSDIHISIRRILRNPMNESEIATALNLSKKHTKLFLSKLVEDGEIEKLKRPVRYISKQPNLLSYIQANTDSEKDK